jgi:hypothetical protein
LDGTVVESSDQVFITNLCNANGIDTSTIVSLDDSAEALAAKIKAKAQIDALANEIYYLFVPSPGLLKEYQQAEDDAKAYMADNSIVPQSISSWAIPKNWTNLQAAQDILTQAARLKSIMGKIREIRLSYKEAIDGAASIPEVQVLVSAGLSTLSKLRG